MAWPDDPPPALRHERHSGDRVMRCLVERPRSLFGLLEAAARRDPEALAPVEGKTDLTCRGLAEELQKEVLRRRLAETTS